MKTPYTKKTLTKDEKVKLVVNFHPMRWLQLHMLPMFVIGVVLMTVSLSQKLPVAQMWPALVFPAVFIIVSLCIYCMTIPTEAVVTSKRVVSATGVILYINGNELKNEKIEAIEVKQSLLGRILNYGSIRFSGIGTAQVVFADIRDPYKIKTKIEEIF